MSRGGICRQTPMAAGRQGAGGAAAAATAAAAHKVKSSKLRPKSENQYIKLINWEY